MLQLGEQRNEKLDLIKVLSAHTQVILDQPNDESDQAFYVIIVSEVMHQLGHSY